MNDAYQQSETADKLENLIKPMIYSKRVIWGFSILFSPLFGGVLLMQNLKDIDKKKEANLVLILSILMTAITIIIVTVFEIKSRSVSFLCNIAGAAILTEYFYNKYFPDEAEYEKKKIWKPLIIGIIIVVVFVLLLFLAQDQVV